MNKIKEIIDSNKENILSDLKQLISIESVLTKYDQNNLEQPFGPGPRRALDYMHELCKRDNFDAKNIANHVLEINYGKQEKFIVLAGHLDVVPVGTGWHTNPFEMSYEKENDLLIGRGTLDDKGASIAAYYALKIIKDNNIKLKRRVKLLYGTDEESGSRCMKKYNELVKEVPDYGFIPDSDFPLIFSEKGILRLDLYIKDDEILNAYAGERYNMVPEEATIEFMDTCSSTAKGISAHGSTPEKGENAILNLIKDIDKEGQTSNLVQFIKDFFIKEIKDDKVIPDTIGEKLGIMSPNLETGDLSVNLGFMRVENNKVRLGLDIRYPNTTSLDEIILKLKNTLHDNNYDIEISNIVNSNPLYYSPKSKLVKTLHKIYKKHTHDKKTTIIATGGGTYAREFKNTIAFGPQFPNEPSLMHAPNEGYKLSNLLKCIEIYYNAIIKLANLK